MSSRQRIALFLVFLGTLTFLGLLFAPFVIERILRPLAVAVWFILRIFILSIDQYVYWGIFVLVAFIWIARRLVGRGSETGPFEVAGQNDAVLSIEKWFNRILLATNYLDMRQQLKNELLQMLVTLHSSRQQEATFSEVYEPLRQRQIPLPDPVYDFLFASPVQPKPQNFIQKLISIPDLPRKWWRKWSGQETAELQQSVENVLNFMETMLENRDDTEPPNHSNP